MRFKLKILFYLLKLKLSKIVYRHNYGLIQKIRWKRQVKKLRQSKFYKPFVIESESLAKLPIVNKEIFMREFNDINTCNIELKDALETAIKAEHSRDFSPLIHGITIGYVRTSICPA